MWPKLAFLPSIKQIITLTITINSLFERIFKKLMHCRFLAKDGSISLFKRFLAVLLPQQMCTILC